MEPTVYVITPVHNRRHFTEPFLRCLHRQTYSNLHIIIIDDGSIDGTSEMIQNQFPNVKILRGDGNLYTTASWNLAIRYIMAKGSHDDFTYIVVLNDDLEVDDNYIETLVCFAQSKPNSLVGSVVVDINNPDKIISGGVVVNLWTAKHHVLNRGINLSELEHGYYAKTSWLTGRGTLIPMSVFREIGLYDEIHFTRCGDTELPVRAAHNGYNLLVCYGAIVKSHIDQTYSLNKTKYYRLRDTKDYFFSINSYSRIKYRYYLIRAAANGNLFRFAIYLAADLTRITLRFFLRIRPNPM